MLKRLVLQYWPLVLLLVLIVAILGMSRYAEHRKAENQEYAQASGPETTVTPSETDKGGKPTKKPKYPPSWVDTFAWPDGVTGWALFLTLFVIAWQSVETHSAAEAASASAETAKRQTDLMVEKERAKLRIKLDDFQLERDEYGVYNVSGSVLIYGNSEAFIEKTEVYASVGAGGIFNPPPEWLWGLHLDPVVRSNSAPIPFTVTVMGEDGPADEEQILPIRKAAEFVYCMAKIEFSDTYGQKWVFRLRRRFRFIWSQIESPAIGGGWEDSGPESDNGEYRNDADRPTKPN